MANEHKVFDLLYSNQDTPWIKNELPFEILKLLSKKIITPCKMLDIGCGVGNYSIEFAKRGFDVTGIDFSKVAINKANENMQLKKCNCNFINMDLKNLNNFNYKFDFIFEWRYLNSLTNLELEKYIQNIHNILNINGIYISAFFNEDSCSYIVRKDNTSKLGTNTYFYSKNIISNLFSSYFKIIEYKKIKLDETTIYLDYFITKK